MTELKMGPRMVFAVVGLGIILGVVLGLFVAWDVWPIQVSSVDVTDLRTKDQNDYIVLTASAFVYDQDVSKARGRLANLNDDKIVDRIASLAKSMASQDDPDAKHVAALAIGLGSSDKEVNNLAATPTITPTQTPLPTPTRAPTLTLAPPTSTVPPTAPAAKTQPPTRTPRPVASPTPKVAAPAPPAATNWIPSFPSEWPGGANYKPVSVAPGTKYWHLVRAQYCDDRDQRNDCPNLPGGDIGTSTYVMLLDSNGGRTSSPLIIRREDGGLEKPDEKSPEDSCNCNYSMFSNGWAIQVAGAPSDTVSGLALYSVRMRLPQAHTRYYLYFQLLTR